MLYPLSSLRVDARAHVFPLCGLDGTMIGRKRGREVSSSRMNRNHTERLDERDESHHSPGKRRRLSPRVDTDPAASGFLSFSSHHTEGPAEERGGADDEIELLGASLSSWTHITDFRLSADEYINWRLRDG